MLLPSLLPSSLYKSNASPSGGQLNAVVSPTVPRWCPTPQSGLGTLRLHTGATKTWDPQQKQSLFQCFAATSQSLQQVSIGGGTATAAAPSSSRPAPRQLANLVPAVAYQAKEPQQLGDVLRQAGKRALGGGIPGAAAMALQVFTLMWLRTTINYQYRYGTTTGQALRTLYKEGGIPRFYRGLLPALVQGPLSRFGDTAANAGVLSILNEHESTSHLPIGVKTMAASASAGAFRIFLMPVDAVKTIMQVEGKAGFPALVSKVRTSGPTVLYHGAIAASVATFVGHYPWFATYNYLNEKLPKPDTFAQKLMRSALIGFCASLISDTCSNSIRVVKTAKQASTVPVTYPQVVKMVIEKDGYLGLFGRGLKTKILANGLQGLLFSVFWRLGQDYWNAHVAQKGAGEAKA